MIELIDQLYTEPDPTSDASDLRGVYDLATIRTTATRCIDLVDDAVLAVRIEDIHVSFAVFQLHCGPATRNGVVVDGAKMSLVFAGNGPSGALRELRHTNWGERGYLFDPPAKVIAAAFKALAEWFDVN